MGARVLTTVRHKKHAGHHTITFLGSSFSVIRAGERRRGHQRDRHEQMRKQEFEKARLVHTSHDAATHPTRPGGVAGQRCSSRTGRAAAVCTSTGGCCVLPAVFPWKSRAALTCEGAASGNQWYFKTDTCFGPVLFVSGQCYFKTDICFCCCGVTPLSRTRRVKDKAHTSVEKPKPIAADSAPL
jgi:hypothetical protein